MNLWVYKGEGLEGGIVAREFGIEKTHCYI